MTTCSWVTDLEAKSAELGRCGRQAVTRWEIRAGLVPPNDGLGVCLEHGIDAREWVTDTYGLENVTEVVL